MIIHQQSKMPVIVLCIEQVAIIVVIYTSDCRLPAILLFLLNLLFWSFLLSPTFYINLLVSPTFALCVVFCKSMNHFKYEFPKFSRGETPEPHNARLGPHHAGLKLIACTINLS